MTSLFVTGTDTDVGKTCVTASIVNYLSKMNVDVGVMKPFASGYKATNDSVSDDVKILMKYSRVDDPIDLVNPYFLKSLRLHMMHVNSLILKLIFPV